MNEFSTVRGIGQLYFVTPVLRSSSNTI